MQEQKIVYLLWHSHKISKEDIDDKLIGVFITRKSALMAKAKIKNKKGFKSFPRGFIIDRYEVGKIYWEEGFVTL